MAPRYGHTWDNAKRRLRVIMTAEIHEDGRLWAHVSVSHPKRVPNYEEMAYVKRHWIGDDYSALQIFPKKEFHVNIHPRCLHLFACIAKEGDGLPEFSTETIIGRGI